MTMRTTATMTVLSLAMGLGACDATGTADGTARMEIAARGNEPPPSASAAPADAPSPTHGSADGTIDFRARVYVATASGAWVRVTEAAQGSVDASGHAAARTVATGRVAASSYSRVRIVFERVDAHLSGQLLVSTGVLSGTVSVQASSGNEIVVERELAVTARAGATTRLLIDLNADAWLNQASAQSRTVAESAFRAAVRVSAG
jgi:hypothetical protein